MDKFIENIKNGFSGAQNIVVAVLDMLLFASALFLLFKFLSKKNAGRLVLIIIPALLATVVFTSPLIGFPLMGSVFSYVILFALFLPVILFPSETRRGLWRISSPRELREHFNTSFAASDEELKSAIDEIVRAAQNLAKKNTGALIVIVPDTLPPHILESGTAVEGKISAPLIETIFHNKTPLHDGALCIHGDRIMAAGCFLPLSQSRAIDKELGTRHRAALGVTEAYKVFTIIVSEETGVISTARDGLLTRYYDSAMLTDILLQVYGLKAAAIEKTRGGRAKTRTRARTRTRDYTGKE